MLTYRREVLSEPQLQRLSEHTYTCTTASLLDPLLQPWWRFLATLMPRWLAPNLITVAGLLVNLLTTLPLVWLSPDALTEPPAWACLLCALGLFVYQSLDAVDGKQARATGTSSPLGELVDHGCDAVSAVLIIAASCVSLRLGALPRVHVAVTTVGLAAFYSAHWRAYATRDGLRFRALDVTETQCAAIVVHLTSATLGTSFWTDTVLPGVGCPLLHAACACIFTGTVAFLVQGMVEVFASDVDNTGSFAKGTSVFGPGIPLLLAVLPTCVFSGGVVHTSGPALYLLANGLVVSKATVRLVVAHMTRSPLDWLDPASTAVATALLLQECAAGESPLSARAVLGLCLAWSAADLLAYSSVVCRQICDHMRLRLFHIPYRKSPGEGLKTAMPVDDDQQPTTPLEVALKTAMPVDDNQQPTTPLEVTLKTAMPMDDNQQPNTPLEVTLKTAMPVDDNQQPITPLEVTLKTAMPLDDELQPIIPLEKKLKKTMLIDEERLPITPLGDKLKTAMQLDNDLQPITPLEVTLKTAIPLDDELQPIIPQGYRLKSPTPLQKGSKTGKLLGNELKSLEDRLKTTTSVENEMTTTTKTNSIRDELKTASAMGNETTMTSTQLGDDWTPKTPARDGHDNVTGLGEDEPKSIPRLGVALKAVKPQENETTEPTALGIKLTANTPINDMTMSLGDNFETKMPLGEGPDSVVPLGNESPTNTPPENEPTKVKPLKSRLSVAATLMNIMMETTPLAEDLTNILFPMDSSDSDMPLKNELAITKPTENKLANIKPLKDGLIIATPLGKIMLETTPLVDDLSSNSSLADGFGSDMPFGNELPTPTPPEKELTNENPIKNRFNAIRPARGIMMAITSLGGDSAMPLPTGDGRNLDKLFGNALQTTTTLGNERTIVKPLKERFIEATPSSDVMIETTPPGEELTTIPPPEDGSKSITPKSGAMTTTAPSGDDTATAIAVPGDGFEAPTTLGVGSKRATPLENEQGDGLKETTRLSDSTITTTSFGDDTPTLTPPKDQFMVAASSKDNVPDTAL